MSVLQMIKNTQYCTHMVICFNPRKVKGLQLSSHKHRINSFDVCGQPGHIKEISQIYLNT